jgi:hypothetical protein
MQRLLNYVGNSCTYNLCRTAKLVINSLLEKIKLGSSVFREKQHPYYNLLTAVNSCSETEDKSINEICSVRIRRTATKLHRV